MTSKQTLTNAFRGIRVFLPNYTVALVRPSRNPMKPRHMPAPEELARPGGPISKVSAHLPRERKVNDVVFRVDMKMNKPEIKEYLESIYGIEVVQVTSQIVPGKQKRMHARTRAMRKTKDYKLAYVTLPEGQHFPFPSKAELFDESSSE